ncbi:laminin subunit gamma-2 isoform X2 [Poecilia latipinna]|uniref:laminin subunit gamma-2 isoform X2 n=1 Tax=Poecilia latipinna TaxID=48699 RepID=UPI00072EBD0C|nr:PREDICTED: laminin subunit gamma-2-like isoform X2 [Poecilia latipinna]
MQSCWVLLCVVLAALGSVQTTYTSYSASRCECGGRARLCQRDAWGLRCLDCQGNTEGRHCERCKDGFYQQGARLSCTPCSCNPAGSVSNTCDSRGRCSCKDGVSGDKCDLCPDGPMGADGCRRRRQEREDSGSLTLPCFCYGHSERCSARPGFSVHNVSSTFSSGPDGWTVATVQRTTPQDVLFRWSPKHQDLEVISKQSLPTYLYAPDAYLGNKLLSYGQNLSFSLRLDRGVRHPSTSDVVLEGGGLRVAAALGDLRAVVPCGKKISYTFRLDEKSSSKWKPQLSSFEFQKLLQNLTAIKIRATFGEDGRGYLDDVNLVSAWRGDGVAAGWVQTCTCPPGYEGDFCERCSAGFRRRAPSSGAFSACEPCSCRGGSCDPQTGDCYSADETPGERSCSEGFYRDQQGSCERCPCPDRTSCSLQAGALEPQCLRCPPGTFGFYCDTCREGFYGDPAGLRGAQRPCRPCSCNGHIDVNAAGSCDRSSGECLRCLNNTTGRFCESCLPRFYRDPSGTACKPCSCNILGSEDGQCDAAGRCRCRPGFQGPRCDRPDCPTCFTPIRKKMELYSIKLKELELLFSEPGRVPTNRAEMEAALRAMEGLMKNLQQDAEQLTDQEKSLQTRLSSISSRQLTEEQQVQNISQTVKHIGQQQRTFKSKVQEVETLIGAMKKLLDEAKTKIQAVELPVRDDPLTSGSLSSLVQQATGLADEHKTAADSVEQTANEALSDSKQSLDLVRTLMNKENKVKELIGDLQDLYDKTSADVKSLEKRAGSLSDDAKQETKMADSMLKDISRLEKNLPSSMKDAVDAMATRLDALKEAAQKNMSAVDDLLGAVEDDRTDAEDLLDQGQTAQQEFNELLDRVRTAKAETDKALQSVGPNNDLDDTLSTLRGFDQQISDSKAEADEAIKRLPNIDGTIQAAVGKNGQAQSVLDAASKDHDEAMGNINALDGLAKNLQNTAGSLPDAGGLVSEADKLNQEAKNLKAGAERTAEGLRDGLKEAEELAAGAQEAAAGATAALANAKQSKDAVQETLRSVSNMLANLNSGPVVDEEQLRRLEEALGRAEAEVLVRLRPQLDDMEDQEEAHRRRLAAINADIDSILRDIANLEDIRDSIPAGCYNTPPIEEP